jgi:NADH-quinone oxidoreductase subunit D
MVIDQSESMREHNNTSDREIASIARHPSGQSTSKRARRDLLNVDYGLGGLHTTLYSRKLEDDLHTESMILNMGPTHPATHGTVRIVAELSGEKIIDADIEVGYLHRGFEKMCETVDYNQCMPYTDRLNYVSPIINNFGFCLTVEKLLQIEVPKRCQYIRVIMSEISRVSDHLTCLGASAMELGAFTVMLYMMQAREYLWELIEDVTGARLTISYGRVGGVKADLTSDFFEKAKKAFKKVRELLVDCDRLLARNRIFIDRMCDIAVVTAEDAINYSLTGPLLRASGVKYDVRKDFPYSSYDEFQFEVPVGVKGDNYDRFLVRFNEMEESIKICEQAIKNIPDGPVVIDDPHIVLTPKDEVYSSIDGMINHFEMVIFGVQPPVGDVYMSVEGGNGELGFYLVSDGTGKPYKLHVRAPSFIHMGCIRKMLLGHTVADVVPTFGMINMIGGECDR